MILKGPCNIYIGDYRIILTILFFFLSFLVHFLI